MYMHCHLYRLRMRMTSIWLRYSYPKQKTILQYILIFLPMSITLFRFSACPNRLSWSGDHQHHLWMFSAVPAFEIIERVSSSIFCRTGALAAHATKTKYLKNVLNSTSVVGSMTSSLNCFVAPSNLTSTSSIPVKFWTELMLLSNPVKKDQRPALAHKRGLICEECLSLQP